MNLGKQIEEQIEKEMSINKQVDDMARDLCGEDVDCNKCAELMPCFSRHFSKRAVEKGYRKSTDVAREIFEEIDAHLNLMFDFNQKQDTNYDDIGITKFVKGFLKGEQSSIWDMSHFIDKLKKKYTEGCNG